MKVGLAQVRSETGAVGRNVRRHLSALRRLDPSAADLIVFPELSLSNYDPGVAAASALSPEDGRLDPLRAFADESGVAVAVGAPLAAEGRPQIAALVFVPGGPPVVVGKRWLHEDEAPFFSPAAPGVSVLGLAVPVGVAICYEVTVAAHAAALVEAGAAVYVASVAKTPRGVTAARAALSETARRHRIPALMANSVGTCEGEPAGGGSMVIGREGRLLRQLNGSDEAVLVYDTEDEATTVWAV